MFFFKISVHIFSKLSRTSRHDGKGRKLYYVHFDYYGVSYLSQQNLLAFQRIWDSYNPSSRTDEDGVYRPQTYVCVEK